MTAVTPHDVPHQPPALPQGGMQPSPTWDAFGYPWPGPGGFQPLFSVCSWKGLCAPHYGVLVNILS